MEIELYVPLCLLSNINVILMKRLVMLCPVFQRMMTDGRLSNYIPGTSWAGLGWVFQCKYVSE